MDYKLGGLKGSPKFMMPNSLNFLLRYSVQEKNKIAEEVTLMVHSHKDLENAKIASKILFGKSTKNDFVDC